MSVSFLIPLSDYCTAASLMALFQYQALKFNRVNAPSITTVNEILAGSSQTSQLVIFKSSDDTDSFESASQLVAPGLKGHSNNASSVKTGLTSVKLVDLEDNEEDDDSKEHKRHLIKHIKQCRVLYSPSSLSSRGSNPYLKDREADYGGVEALSFS